MTTLYKFFNFPHAMCVPYSAWMRKKEAGAVAGSR